MLPDASLHAGQRNYHIRQHVLSDQALQNHWGVQACAQSVQHG